MFVKKRDGSQEKFDKNKIARSCKRAGTSDVIAKEISNVVSNEAYDGISTEEIRLVVLRELSRKDEKTARSYRDYKE